jgi:hypothetical protein
MASPLRVSRWALALSLLPACTAVLGIHRADLDDGGMSAPSGGFGGSTMATGSKSKCETAAPSCSACLKASCPSDTTDCLESSDCRKSLNAYGECLHSDCEDEGQTCAEQKLSGGTQSSENIANCLFANCLNPCAKSAVVSKCELYCSCIQDLCSSGFTTMQGCLDNCSAQDPRSMDCRWVHCEYAAIDATTHCPHALATNDVCKQALAPTAQTCLNGNESGFPCNKSADCCSGICQASVCK